MFKNSKLCLSESCNSENMISVRVGLGIENIVWSV